MDPIRDIAVVEDGLGVVCSYDDGRKGRFPLKRLVPGEALLKSTRPRLIEANLAGPQCQLRLSDGLEYSLGTDRLVEGPVPDPDGPARADLLVRNIGQLITGTADHETAAEGAAVAARAGRIVALGPESEVLDRVRPDRDTIQLDAAGGLVSPGLTDPHTHPVFGGDRGQEFALRAAGATYQEIAAAGGGIRSTVEATRRASLDELEMWGRERLLRLLARGVTTVEAKSGYALDTEGELRLLQVIRRLDCTLPMDLSPTLLGAHVVPPEYAEDRAGYLDMVCNEMIPRAAREGLAESVDVFCDAGAFDLQESRRVLETARDHGLARRIHAEQFVDLDAAGMAADLGAVSADHLEAVSPAAMQRMAAAGTVAVLLPGAALTLACPWPPARDLLEAGVALALGTDLNPGTSMTEDLHLMMSLGCMQMGMTVEQCWEAVTRNAARAALRPDAGQLQVDGPADLVIYDCNHYAWIPYHLGANHVRTVVKDGRIALER